MKNWINTLGRLHTKVENSRELPTTVCKFRTSISNDTCNQAASIHWPTGTRRYKTEVNGANVGDTFRQKRTYILKRPFYLLKKYISQIQKRNNYFSLGFGGKICGECNYRYFHEIYAKELNALLLFFKILTYKSNFL